MSSNSGSLLRVVAIDDDQFVRSMLSSMLVHHGFEVHTAATVGEFIQAVREVDPHVVIADLDLGKPPTGLQLLRMVNNEAPWVGKVLLTTHHSPG